MGSLWRLLGFVRPYWAQLVLASFLVVGAGALVAVVVSTIKPLVNEVLLPESVATPAAVVGDAEPPVSAKLSEPVEFLRSWLPTDRFFGWARQHVFVEVPLLIVLIFFVRVVLLYFGEYLTVKCGASMVRDLRIHLFESVVHQSPAFFQAHPTGMIVSRILNDVARVQRVATISLADLVRVTSMVPFLLITAFVHEWRMSMLALVALPLLGWPMVRLGKRLRRAATASQENMADVAHKLTEAVGGVRVVQAFGMQQYEAERFRGALQRMLRADLRAGRAAALAPALMELFGAVAGAALFWAAGREIARNRLDPGAFAVVLFCLGLLFISVRKLNALYAEMQQALSAADRIFDMMDREAVVHDATDAQPLSRFEREICFRDVSFSYGDEMVLRGVDLRIRRGEIVAVVGPSGAGKSTLIGLLPRFHDPASGTVEIDGVGIHRVTLASLRGQIGLVTQETMLFDDTVRNNIAYGRADVPQEQVEAAARAAQAAGFIEELPAGYETILGERGARLSMGQRQRLAIARALLKDPPILILDEATSALDAESEALVQEALETLMRGRTSLVIAHRLSTVRRADRIVVLDRGRIVEQGPHDDLIRQGGLYARLHELQFQEF